MEICKKAIKGALRKKTRWSNTVVVTNMLPGIGGLRTSLRNARKFLRSVSLIWFWSFSIERTIDWEKFIRVRTWLWKMSLTLFTRVRKTKLSSTRKSILVLWPFRAMPRIKPKMTMSLVIPVIHQILSKVTKILHEAWNYKNDILKGQPKDKHKKSISKRKTSQKLKIKGKNLSPTQLRKGLKVNYFQKVLRDLYRLSNKLIHWTWFYKARCTHHKMFSRESINRSFMSRITWKK